MKIIFLGTSSGVGKTTIAAMFCRYLKRKGIRATPFKAYNVSSHSYVTEDAGEIGIGQAFQAFAAGTEPSKEMNPILIKYTENGVQRSVNDTEKKDKMDIALASFDRLCNEYEAVVCEGSGSPAELNLMKDDVANIRLAAARKIPAVLIGDIERGGVFAGLYGTWKLIDESERHLIKGFIINRFRGDASILRSGTDRITEMTGMEFLGVMPLTDLKFPEEDSSFESEDIDEKKEYYIKNIDEFLDIAEGHLNLERLLSIAKE